MRILQLGKFYPLLGGVEIVMHRLALGLSERGYRCDLLYASQDGETSTIEVNPQCRLYRCKTILEAKATMISPGMILRLRRMRKDYDIIHIHHPDPMAALALFLSGFKGKVVLHWHSDIIRQHRLLKFYTPLQSWLIGRADLIVGTSPVYIKESDALKHVQHKTVCVPIGVLDPSAQKEEVHVDLAGRYPGKKIIFTIGRLVLYKGLNYLIETAKYIPNDYVLLIGGKGFLHDSLQRQIEAEGLQDKVKLIGFIPQGEIVSYFKACKIFCLASIDKREAFAIVQVQALAFGKPIVSTNIPGSGVPWVNKDGESGFTVEPCNSKALAEAIVRLCNDEELYQRLSRQARARYERLFRYDQMINRMEALYNNLFPEKTIANETSI